MPSPCFHSGKCSISRKQFACDCADTGYVGETCNRGILEISGQPQLTVNHKSDVIRIKGKPEKYVEIIPFTDDPSDAVFHPFPIFIHSDKNEVSFSVTAKKQGAIKIKYKLKGPDADSYEVPKETILHASLTRQPLQAVLVDKPLFETCQRLFHSTICSGKSKVYLKSTCAWSLGTHGYVTVGNENNDVPLSLNGIEMSTFTNIYVTEILSFQNEIETFLNTRSNYSRCETCSLLIYNSNIINFLLDNHYFQYIMLKRVSKAWPFWMDIRPGNGSITLPENVKSNFGSGINVMKQTACSMLPMSPNNHYVIYLPRMPITFLFLSIEKRFNNSITAYCFAVDLCEEQVHISLPRSFSLDFTPNFQSSGVENFRLKVTQLSLINEKACFRFKTLRNVGCVKCGMIMRVTGDLDTKTASFVFDGTVHLDNTNFPQVCYLYTYGSYISKVYPGDAQIMNMYICVCLCVCMRVRVRLPVCLYACAHACMCVRVRVRTREFLIPNIDSATRRHS